jgi:uncharacterized membrane protein YkvA (DUF1232 family)
MAKEKSPFEATYSESNFWEKLTGFAKVAGSEVVEKALWLYYAYKSPETPIKAKAIILGALGYFISPIDAIPDILPVIGYSDDLGVLVAAVAAVAMYISPEIKSQASSKMNDWFGD